MIPRMPRPLYIAYRLAEMLVSLASRFINAAFLGGSTYQTTSARSHIEPWPRAKRIINALFFWQDDHCLLSFEKDLERARQTINAAKGD